MSPETQAAAPSLLAGLDPATILWTFQSVHPKVQAAEIRVVDDVVYVVTGDVWFETTRAAQRSEAIAFRHVDPPGTVDPDHPRRLRPVEVVSIPLAAAPSPTTVTEAPPGVGSWICAARVRR
jgi:hypothetical protein